MRPTTDVDVKLHANVARFAAALEQATAATQALCADLQRAFTRPTAPRPEGHDWYGFRWWEQR